MLSELQCHLQSCFQVENCRVMMLWWLLIVPIVPSVWPSSQCPSWHRSRGPRRVTAPRHLPCCTTAIDPNRMKVHASAFPASKTKRGSNSCRKNNFKIQSNEAHASTLRREFSWGLPAFKYLDDTFLIIKVLLTGSWFGFLQHISNITFPGQKKQSAWLCPVWPWYVGGGNCWQGASKLVVFFADTISYNVLGNCSDTVISYFLTDVEPILLQAKTIDKKCFLCDSIKFVCPWKSNK